MKLENVKFAFVTQKFSAELLCDKLDVSMAVNDNAMQTEYSYSLQWRHNGHGSVSNHRPRYCLLNRLFRRRSKKNMYVKKNVCYTTLPQYSRLQAQHKHKINARIVYRIVVRLIYINGWENAS